MFSLSLLQTNCYTAHWKEKHIPCRKPVFHVKYYITNSKQVSTSVHNIKLSLRVEIQLFWVFFFVFECLWSFLRNSEKYTGSKLLYSYYLGNVHKWCPILRGEGGSSKMGQNGTRGVGRRAKIGRPIFQEFLPLFFCGFIIFFLFLYTFLLFQCDSFINISWKCRFIK